MARLEEEVWVDRATAVLDTEGLGRLAHRVTGAAYESRHRESLVRALASYLTQEAPLRDGRNPRREILAGARNVLNDHVAVLRQQIRAHEAEIARIGAELAEL